MGFVDLLVKLSGLRSKVRSMDQVSSLLGHELNEDFIEVPVK